MHSTLTPLDAGGVAQGGNTPLLRAAELGHTAVAELLLLHGALHVANHDGNTRKLFNTSGGDYKALNLKEKLPNMTKTEAIDILSKNGNLIKRPFVIVGDRGLVGFKEKEWGERI